MTWWTDRLGYEGREMRCTAPPVWMRVSEIRSRGYGGGTARALEPDELMATMEHVLAAGLPAAAEELGLSRDAVKNRMRQAGYGYDAAAGKWVPL